MSQKLLNEKSNFSTLSKSLFKSLDRLAHFYIRKDQLLLPELTIIEKEPLIIISKETRNKD